MKQAPYAPDAMLIMPVIKCLPFAALSLSLSLSLRFNGHFPGEPGLAGFHFFSSIIKVFVEAKDDEAGGNNWTTGAISRAKLQSNHHHQQTNIQFFTGQMPFLSPNQQCQSTERKNVTFYGLAYPKLTWGSSNFVSDY